MNPSLAIVRRKVAELRRRLFRVRALEGLSLTGGAVLVVLLLGWLLPLLPALPGLALRLLLLLAALAAPVLFLVRPLRRRPGDDQLALRIEAVFPELGNALINAIQLGREQAAPDLRHPFSTTLLEKHLDEAAAKALAVRLDRVAPLHALKQRFLFLAGALMLVLLAQAWVPHFLARSFSALAQKEFSLGPGIKSSLARSAEPLTAGEFGLRYTYPAYTGRGRRTVEPGNGAVTALKGTQVEFWTEVLEDVREARAVLEPGGKIPVAVSRGHELRGALTVMAAGKYYLEATDRRGKYRAEPRGHQILVEEDLYPEVTLEKPVADLEVSVGDSVEIIYQAADDFGLSQVSVVYRVGQEEKRREVFRAEQPATKRRARFVWRLAAEEVKPGDAVAFYLEALDNDNVSGPKAGKSRTVNLEIFSPRKRHEQMISRQEDLFEQLVVHLADHLDDELNRQNPKGPYRLEKSEPVLLKGGRALQGQMNKLAADLENDQLTEDLVRATLVQIAESLDHLLSLRESNLARLPAGAGVQLKFRDQYLREIESDVIFFDKLIKKQKIDQVLAESQDLYAAQADLADLLQRFQKTGDPALWEQIQKKMAEVTAAYQALLEKMAKMSKELPEEFVNAEAMDKMKINDLSQQMRDLQRALAAGDMKAAMDLANSFLSSLNQMMSAMEDSAGQYGEAVSAETLRRMGAMKDELADLEKAQQKLIDRSEELERQSLAQVEKATAGAVERILKKTEALQQKITDLQKKLEELRPGPEAPAMKPTRSPQDFYQRQNNLHNQMLALKSEVGQRKQEIAAGQLQPAREGFQRQETSLDQAQKQIEDLIARHQPLPKEQSRSLPGQCSAAGSLNSEIKRDLESLQQALARKPGPEAEARLQSMSAEQEKLKQRTEKLRNDFDSLSQDLPQLPAEIGKTLDEGQAFMHDAAGELSLQDPGRALVPEREAKQRLAQARQALDRAAQQMAQGMKPGMGLPMMAGAPGRRGAGGSAGVYNKDFELPPQNAYQVPRAFRQDLLEMMKDAAPEEYKDLNRDYYERLVR
jgi:hypothetical protein